jgi:hypothetical protein
MKVLEIEFCSDQQAWVYAEDYGVDSVKEKHTGGKVTYVVSRKILSGGNYYDAVGADQENTKG